MLAANVGAQVTAFVTTPVTALVLANMKEATGSSKPLLSPDPTQPTRRVIFGVPLLASPEDFNCSQWQQHLSGKTSVAGSAGNRVSEWV
jgi:hypothetical protein